MAKQPATQTITGIERAADVLTLFSTTDEPTLGVTEVAQALGLSKAVIYRILSSFRAKGFIELDESTRRYSLGPQALHLGLAFLRRTNVHALARPEMERLSRATAETATLSIRTGATRVYVDQVTPDRDVKMVVHVGQKAPLHAGGSSKAFLAFVDPAERDRYLSGKLQKLTKLTITSAKALKRELEDVRARGYATSLGERLEGAGSVAAPVFGHDGRPVAVISVCGPAERIKGHIREHAALLLEGTERISRQLGYRKA